MLFVIFLSGCAPEKAKTEVATLTAEAQNIITTIFANDTSKGTTPGGYGYNLAVINGKDTFRIHQPTIPAIQGNRGFATRDDAGKVAALVAGKIKAGNSFPTIDIKELDSLGVDFK